MNKESQDIPKAEKAPIQFMKLRLISVIFSLVLIAVSIGSLFVQQLNFGLDFTGGTLLEVEYQTAPSLPEIRKNLDQAGYRNAIVQYFGTDTDVVVRLPQLDEVPAGSPVCEQKIADIESTGIQLEGDARLGEVVFCELGQWAGEEIEKRRLDFVGPQVGAELRDQGGLALIFALLTVMIYVAFRFQFKFAVGAVSALIHDVLIVVGCFSFFHWDFDLTVLAALLAVIGYSLNDTIVVADRIRENFRRMRKGDSEYIINVSLTQTMGRTLVTSITTLLVLLALLLFGGEMIHGFALALFIGVLIGTYSSVYVSANLLLMMNVSREDLIVPDRENDPELDAIP